MAKIFLVVGTRIYILAFFAMDNSRTRILTERQFTLCSHFSIAKHGESHELVVLACFRICKDFGYHLIVFATQHESIVMSSLTGNYPQSLGVYDQKLVAAPVFHFHVIGSEMVVFGCVRSERKHFLILERFCCHYDSVLKWLFLPQIYKIPRDY